MLRQTIEDLRRRIATLRRRFAPYVLLPDLDDDMARALRRTVSDEGVLSPGYLLMCALSAGIATFGLLQSSPAVVIGAMLISPLMSPIASLGFGFASLDGKWIKRAARVVATGSAIGIVTGMVLTWISPIDNPTGEIIARTQPTLLDLAVALLSGIAGGYATVNQRGGTAIGVAIATALMPPLATIGYGLGAARIDFASGALLLFLTNLAAIAFSFALIARLSGAARPIATVELAPQHIGIGIAAFLALATPLAWTLNRIVIEADARGATRELLKAELGIGDSGIAQLDVHRSLLGDVSIDAVVIAPRFRNDAHTVIERRLEQELGRAPKLNLQQVVAADIDSRAHAIVDAAMARTVAGMARDVPPVVAIRGALGIPLQGVWSNRSERTVDVAPFAVPGWTIPDYRAAEQAATAAAGKWRVQLSPPLTELAVPFDPPSPEAEASDRASAEAAIEDAVWALHRWNVARVSLAFRPAGDTTTGEVAAPARVLAVAARLRSAGFDVEAAGPAGTEAEPQAEPQQDAAGTVIVVPRFPTPPVQVER